MNIQGKHYQSIWEEAGEVYIIDQRKLPHQLVIESLESWEEAATAIRDMYVRGAPLIGATAAYGLYLAAKAAPEDAQEYIERAARFLGETRPTAVDLFFALQGSLKVIAQASGKAAKTAAALQYAKDFAQTSADHCHAIGKHGLELIRAIAKNKPGEPVNILTHCNAGWLACIDYGTSTAPIYLAHDAGIPVHVWVDETRPRNQGSKLTAYELLNHGVPHTVITDNTGGHLMQHGMVDMVIVGSDRTTRQGDVANKIGTYLKALAAHDNGVPFYVALPYSSFDWTIRDGLQEIPIEERDAAEVKYIEGLSDGAIHNVLITPEGSPAKNYGFDVTPARLVSGLITERGICAASEAALLDLYPEHR